MPYHVEVVIDLEITEQISYLYSGLARDVLDVIPWGSLLSIYYLLYQASPETSWGDANEQRKKVE
jgi:hypothetical protein